jgi:anti-sigma B factor antagonist
MSVPLLIAQRNVGDVTVLELSGHLVFDAGEREFREKILSLVKAGRTRILVDLRNVTYIDSGGVGGLVGMFLHVHKRGGEMKLICPSHRARRVLKITKLLSIFEVFPTEAQGIASFATRISAGETGT